MRGTTTFVSIPTRRPVAHGHAIRIFTLAAAAAIRMRHAEREATEVAFHLETRGRHRAWSRLLLERDHARSTGSGLRDLDLQHARLQPGIDVVRVDFGRELKHA